MAKVANGKPSEVLVTDSGPKQSMGEGSLALAKAPA